jgi:hypothetical protein
LRPASQERLICSYSRPGAPSKRLLSFLIPWPLTGAEKPFRLCTQQEFCVISAALVVSWDIKGCRGQACCCHPKLYEQSIPYSGPGSPQSRAIFDTLGIRVPSVGYPSPLISHEWLISEATPYSDPVLSPEPLSPLIPRPLIGARRLPRPRTTKAAVCTNRVAPWVTKGAMNVTAVTARISRAACLL